jgi:hypothetical protein
VKSKNSQQIRYFITDTLDEYRPTLPIAVNLAWHP